jgi:hypothetical protein
MLTKSVVNNNLMHHLLFLRHRNPRPELYEEMVKDEVLRNAFPIMFYFVGLAKTIPSSTASVERTFSLMNSLCTSSRSRLNQSSLDALMRICVHNQGHKSLSSQELNDTITQFKNMKTRDLLL